ncbi:MAG TPA: hypothetical protein DEB06_03980 [Phycisphaerales bacterium]|nr:hypothetical protein [Phycisphaerales bacterium]
MPLSERTLATLLDDIGAKSPAPGGGAVVSIVGSIAAALAQMVVNYSLGRKSLALHEPALRDALHALVRSRAVLLELAEEDMEAYAALNEVQRLPESDPRRARELPALASAASRIPLAVVAACADLVRRCEALADKTNPHLRSDLAIAALLSECAARAGRWNVAINAPLLPEDDARALLGEADSLLHTARERLARVEAACAP